VRRISWLVGFIAASFCACTDQVAPGFDAGSTPAAGPTYIGSNADRLPPCEWARVVDEDWSFIQGWELSSGARINAEEWTLELNAPGHSAAWARLPAEAWKGPYRLAVELRSTDAPVTFGVASAPTVPLALAPPPGATTTEESTTLNVSWGGKRGAIYIGIWGGGTARIGLVTLERCTPKMPACFPGDCPPPDDCRQPYCNPLKGCGISGAEVVCDDGVECTLDHCNGPVCANTPMHSACDDSEPCNGAAACDRDMGCITLPVPEECCTTLSDCDDSDVCNGQESCEILNADGRIPFGRCITTEALQCDDEEPCNGVETCDPVTGCTLGAPPLCGDDNICNGVEFCLPGVGCASSQPLNCDDNNPCTTESCEPSVGCINAGPVSCDDGTICNGVESCVPGLGGCVAGVPLDCDDGKPCNGVETCNPVTGCELGQTVVGCCNNDSDCEDGNLCNGLGACNDSLKTCVVTLPPVCEDGNVCNGAEVCMPQWGCTATAAPQCDDGNVCNGVETCDADGGCLPGVALDCPKGDVCVGLGWCDPLQGCQSTPGMPCDDADVCNGLESCAPDVGCLPGEPLACDDGLPCNGTETCHSAVGCVLSGDPMVAGCCAAAADCGATGGCLGEWTCDDIAGRCVLSTPPAYCDDANACNGKEFCGPAGCDALPAKSCSDADPCTADSCDASTGECVYTPGACEPGCAPGTWDVNQDMADGCELVGDPTSTLFVDGDSADGDGSLEHPFQTIQSAVDAAGPNATIYVLPGLYSEPVTVNKPGSTIIAVTTGSVTLAPASVGVGVSASNVTLKGLRIEGGRIGVLADGAKNDVTGLRISSVTFDSQSALTAFAEHEMSAAIALYAAPDAMVTDVVVSSVTGGAGSPAGAAFGITIEGSDGCTIKNSVITTILGGDSTQWGVGGGHAAGISLAGSSGCTISGNTVDAISGGIGATQSPGGRAVGIALTASTANTVSNNVIGHLIGGAPGTGGGPGDTFGVYMADDSWDNALPYDSAVNTLEGAPIIHVVGAKGTADTPVLIAGFKLTHPTNPTNVAKLSVISSEHVVVANSQIAHFTGEGAAPAGRMGRGVFMHNCAGCSIEQVVVKEIRGGPGTPGSDGGPSAGLVFSGTLPQSVRNVAVHHIHGGKGWAPEVLNQNGAGAAILVTEQANGEQTLAIHHLTAHYIGVTSATSAAINSKSDMATIEVVDSIISRVGPGGTGQCIATAPAGGATAAAYAVRWDACTTPVPEAFDALSAPGEPGFVDADAGDLTLKPTSSCIDAGSPLSPFCGEPEPNGCAVNLGAYGGTKKAASKPGATHCTVCEPAP